MPVAEAHAQPSAPSRPQDGGGRETSAEPGSKERTKEGSGRERDGSMEPHNTSTILATVKEQLGTSPFGSVWVAISELE